MRCNKVKVVFLTKYASFLAPARAVKYFNLVDFLSDYFECVVISPNEPNIDKDKLSSKKVSYIWYYYPGYLLRKVYYKVRNADKRSSETKKTFNNNKLFLKKIFKKMSCLAFPDAYLDTLPISFVLGFCCIIKSKSPVVLVAGGYPFSNFFSGMLLKSIFGHRVRFVVEFRDPFVNNPLNKVGRNVAFLRAYFERILMSKADEVWIYRGWFPLGLNYFSDKYPEYSDKVYELPYSGYDESIFSYTKEKKSKKIKFVHAGNFYGGDYSPVNFFKALARVKDKGFSEFEVFFYGGFSDEYMSIARDLKLEEHVSYHGYIPYADVGKKLIDADVLLWIAGKSISYSDNLPSKIFDYIGASVPIMALLPEGLSKDFAVEHEIEFLSDTSDVDDIERCINEAVSKFNEGELVTSKRNTRIYSYGYLTEFIHDRINKLASK